MKRIISVCITATILCCSISLCKKERVAHEAILGNWTFDIEAIQLDPSFQELVKKDELNSFKKLEVAKSMKFTYTEDKIISEIAMDGMKVKRVTKEIVASVRKPNGELVMDIKDQNEQVNSVILKIVDENHFQIIPGKKPKEYTFFMYLVRLPGNSQ